MGTKKGEASNGEAQSRSPQAKAEAFLSAFPSMLLLAVLVAHYFPFFEDDGYVSLRYAERFLSGKGLTFNDGEFVEGYTNFLWVLLCSLGGAFVPLEWAARILGTSCGVGVLWFAARWALCVGCSRMEAMTVSALLALSGPFAIWSVGGLEANLVALALAWGLDWCLVRPVPLSTRAWAVRGIPAAVLLLCRADAMLLSAGLVGVTLLSNRVQAPKTWFAFAGVSLATLSAHLLFRVTYYGEWLPNTAHVRSGLSLHHLLLGLGYVGSGVKRHAVLMSLIALGVWGLRIASHHEQRISRACLWLGAGSTIYVCIVGGGIFPGYRHLASPLVLLVIPLALGAKRLSMLGSRPWAKRSMMVALVVAQAVLHFTAPLNRKASSDRWQEKSAAMGGGLRAAFRESDPLLVADAAGALAFFSGFRFVDTYGLTNRHIAKSKRKRDSLVGHEKGDGDYLFSIHPDLLIFNDGEGGKPWSVSGQELLAREDFDATYARQCFQILEPKPVVGEFYVNRVGKLGGDRARKGGSIPGWMFRGNGACVVLVENPYLEVPGGVEVSFLLPHSIQAERAWRLSAEGPVKLQVSGERLRVIVGEGGARIWGVVKAD